MKSTPKTWKQPQTKTSIASVDSFIGSIGTGFLNTIRHIRTTMATYSNLSWGVFVFVALAFNLIVTVTVFVENGLVAIGVFIIIAMFQVLCGLFFAMWMDPLYECCCDKCEAASSAVNEMR